MGSQVRSLHGLLRRITFYLLQYLLLSLNLEHHLHVDVFYVVVLFCGDERACIGMQIVQRMAATRTMNPCDVLSTSASIDTQAVIVATVCLLQRIDGIRLH